MKAKLFASSAAIAVCMASVPAFAQDETDSAQARPAGVNVITVTAQKRAESVQDVPIAITAVTREVLETQQINTIADLSKLAPNVQLDASAPIFSSSQILTGFIRGIGQNDISSSLEPGIGIYLDGVILARSIGANVDLLDVERIEILKGPQGTLFGRNTIGGAISVVTREPANSFGFQGELTAGSRDRIEARATVDVPITDSLLTQFSGQIRNQDGYQKILPYPGDTGVTDEYNFNIIPANQYDRRGSTDTWSVRGKVLFEPTSSFSIRLTGDYSKANEQSGPVTLVATDVDAFAPAPTYAAVYNSCVASPPALFEDGGPLAFLAPICGPRGGGIPGADGLPGLAGYNFLNAQPRLTFGDQFITDDVDETYGNGGNMSRVETWGLTGEINVDLTSGLSVKSITGYREVEALLAVDLDGSPIMIGTTLSSLDQQQFSQELQLNFDALEGRLLGVFGLYYFNEKNSNLENAYLSEGLGQFYGPYTNDNDSYAAYLNANFELTDRLSFTFGGRFTRDEKTFEAGQSDINLSLLKLGLFTADQLPDPADPTRLYPLGVQNDVYKDFSLRLGVEYDITPDVMVYGSFAEGFKSGGYTTRLSIPTPGNVPPRFDPEQATTYEIGVKSLLADGRLQLNAAAFHTDYSDLQVIVVRGISPFIENAGTAKIDGFEIEANFVPVPEVRLTASLGYLDARYTQLDPGVTFTLDNAFVNTPDMTAFLAADIDVFEAAEGTVTVHADWSYKSEIARDAVNTPLLIADDQNVMNASVRWTAYDDVLQFEAGVLNLTDERYIVTGTQVDAVGATTATYSRPREYYLTARVKY